MKANLKKLQIAPNKDALTLDWMRKLYLGAFPVEERRPWDDLLQKMLLDEINAYVLWEDDTPIGFITIWAFPDFSYVEHFAIDKSRRGQGYGSRMLSEIKEFLPRNPIVLEVEFPNTDEAIQRIKFYENNAFRLHDEFDYVQPPYTPDLPWVALKIMSFSKSCQSIDLEKIKTNIHAKVYNQY